MVMETTNALTHAGFEELAPNALIHADGSSHLLNISASGFTQGRDGVYTTDALSQECICCLKTRIIIKWVLHIKLL